MKKKTKRLFSLLLVLTLLFGMISLNSGFSAYAEETESPAAEATDETGAHAATEEPAPETEGPADTEPEPTDASEKPTEEETEPPEETETPEEDEPPKESEPAEGKATGTIVELEEIQPSDEAHPFLSDLHQSLYPTFMPLHTDVLRICPSGNSEARSCEGALPRHTSYPALPSLGRLRIRPCTLKRVGQSVV